MLHALVRRKNSRILHDLVGSVHFGTTFDVAIKSRTGFTPRTLADHLLGEDPTSIERRDIAYLLAMYEKQWHTNYRPIWLHALVAFTPLATDLAKLVLEYVM